MRRLLSRLGLFCLLGLMLISGGQGQKAPLDRANRPPLFPCKLGLEEKWQESAGLPLTVEKALSFLQQDPEGTQLIRWGDARHQSLWMALQYRAAGLPADVQASLREAREAEAKVSLEGLRSRDDILELMGHARRFPWAPTIQRALIEAGERELRRGHVGTAEACFRDVLARSADGDQKARAQVGLWLALAHSEREGVLETAFQGIDPEARFPWLGGQARASEIRTRLLAGRVPAPAANLSRLQKRILEVPSASSWVFDRPAIHEEGLAVGGPSLLAWFDGTDPRPVWTQKAGPAPAKELFAPVLPGPYSPAVGAGKVFTRWDIQSLGSTVRNARGKEFPVSVVAFDLRTGARSWSTMDRPEWQELCPVNDPVLAEGRLYVLAVHRKDEFSPIYLVGLDPATGATLFKRELVTFSTTLSTPTDARRPGVLASRYAGVDVVHQGNPVTVAHGKVYCQSNLGVVACCDARDGLVEWVRVYPQDRAAAALRREGSAPIVEGNRVLFVPRDSFGVFAVDRHTGDLFWSRADDFSLRALGVAEKLLILAGYKTLAGLELETGKPVWERTLPEPIEGRAALLGANVLAGTRASLVRLDARTGVVAEEQDWGKTGPLNGLVVRDGVAHGTNIAPQSTPGTTPGSEDILALARRNVRVVHRGTEPARVDGRAEEWDKLQTVPFQAAGGIRGRVLLSHDDENLYLGVSATGEGLDVKNCTLELATSINGRPAKWTLRVDAQGKSLWQGQPATPGMLASMRQPLNDGVLTCEVALPLKVLSPARDARVPAPGRIVLDLVFRHQEAASRQGSSPLVRLTETLSLHWLTRAQEDAALTVARGLNDQAQSWELLEQSWRVRMPEDASSAEFYREFIRQNPRSPGVGLAMVRLDRALRQGPESNPAAEVLPLAEHSGVSPNVRAWYQKVAGSYLSQWIQVDGRSKPQEVILELFDGQSWGHRVTAGSQAVSTRELMKGARSIQVRTINGRTTITIDGVTYDPNQLQRRIHGPLLPPPPAGVWHELRVPLIWVGMHDRPIQGIAFSQVGGGAILWDRTALVHDGKETMLIDDDVTGETEGDWQWQDKPVKSGQKAHTTPPPLKKDVKARHALVFREAIRQHLDPPLGTSGVPAREVLALAEQLPRMKLDPYTIAVHERMDALLRSEKSPRLREVQQAIVQGASRDQVLSWLELLWRMEVRNGNPKAGESIEELIRQSKQPAEVLNEFRKKARHEFIRTWQVIGPLSAEVARTVLMTKKETRFDEELEGLKGKVKWSRLESPSDRIDLRKVLSAERASVAYLACHVYSEKAQDALLQVGSQDGVQVWVSPTKYPQAVIEEIGEREASPAQNSARIKLIKGDNLLLVKVEAGPARGALFLELRETDNSGPLKGIQIKDRRKD